MKRLSEKKFVDKLEESFKLDGFLTRREVGIGYGVADLVIINKNKVNKYNLIKRKEYKQEKKLLHQKYFKILECLPDITSKKKLIGFDTLLKNTTVSKTYLKYNLLKYLEENNFIKKDDNNYYFKLNGWIPLANELIAIEAKLKNWKRGFFQANRYKSFAYISYLAIPFEVGRLVDKTLFKKHNIGLLFFDFENREKKIVVKPRKRKPINSYMTNMALEFFWNSLTLKKLSIV